MDFAVIASRQNIAGMNIASFLQKPLPSHLSLHFIEEHMCFATGLERFQGDCIVFVSSHKSSSGKPTLSTHCIGNWSKAELGGKDRTIIPTNSFLLKNYLLGLQRKKEALGLEYAVCLEATHHGPFSERSVVFIELGSEEKQWNDKNAASAVASVVRESTSIEGNFKSAIALGGGHYCPDFTKLVLRTEWALGHICPEHALPSLDSEMLQKAIDATFPKPEAIIIDWKGLGKEKQRIVEMLSKQELPVLRVQKLLH
ncbi:MAG: D-aminoacyl-tRNA deacylase [archaeon]